MQKLGFKQSEKVAALKPEGFTAPVSEERLDDLDADLLVAFPIYIPDTEVTGDAAFKRIPAVEDRRSLVLTEDLNDVRHAFSLNSVLSAEFAVEKMPELIADSVK